MNIKLVTLIVLVVIDAVFLKKFFTKGYPDKMLHLVVTVMANVIVYLEMR